MVGLTWLVFGRTLTYGFVNYDDDVYVYHNGPVERGLSLPGIIWAFTRMYAGNWHPLTWLSHMTDCALWDLHPAGHHLTNVALLAMTRS